MQIMIIFIYRIHWIQTIKQFMQKLCSIILFLTLDRLYVRSVPPIQELTHLIQYIFSVFYSSPTIFISQIYPYICIFVLALVCRVLWIFMGQRYNDRNMSRNTFKYWWFNHLVHCNIFWHCISILCKIVIIFKIV